MYFRAAARAIVQMPIYLPLFSIIFRPVILSIILTFYPQVSSLKRGRDVSTSTIVPFNLRGAIEFASYAES